IGRRRRVRRYGEQQRASQGLFHAQGLFFHAKHGSFHHVASLTTLLYGRCRRNEIDPPGITHD
ncbi:hypothetical protein, partial [Mesorhizobium sp. M7A.F.Ca.CA.001.04.1.1]|uniref:hypothetical protein n=1 Tax=Mesorhizobium sp. M7A.F.Ca.CA.001.04.1.1 TaxID=2496714 RepID=UPI0019D21B6B